MPAALAARSTGRRMPGNMRTRLWVSTCVSRTPEVLQQGYLRSGFGFDFCAANARGEEALQEAAQSGIKVAGDAIDERGDYASV